MKNAFFLLLSLLCFPSVHAQTVDFAPVGAKWTYSGPGIVVSFSEPYVITCVSKELYQGRLCSKIVNTDIATGLPDPCYMYTQNDSVFFYSPYSNQFQLLYDFGAETGETWTVGGLNTDGLEIMDSVTYIVDSISTYEVNGETLKAWHISRTEPNYDWGTVILENVGNLGILAPRYGLFDTWIFGLRCYEDPLHSYQFVNYPCDAVLTSVTDQSYPTLQISLSPNPVSDWLSVEFSHLLPDMQLRLIDAQGREQYRTALLTEKSNFPIPQLPKNIYFWQVTVGHHLIRSGKLVVE